MTETVPNDDASEGPHLTSQAFRSRGLNRLNSKLDPLVISQVSSLTKEDQKIS